MSPPKGTVNVKALRSPRRAAEWPAERQAAQPREAAHPRPRIMLVAKDALD